VKYPGGLSGGVHLLEEDLRPRVEAYFRGAGFRVHHEVFLLERWIDMLAVKGDVVAVELKIRDWRQAIKQAVMYQLAADYSVVAMPWENAFAAHRHRWRFEEDGVGLLAVRGDEVRVLLDPEYSVRKLAWLNDMLTEPSPVTKRLARRKVEGFTSAADLAPTSVGGEGLGRRTETSESEQQPEAEESDAPEDEKMDRGEHRF